MTGPAQPGTPSGAQRLDKWLWFARVVKTRTLAASLVLDGKVRVNRTRTGKPSLAVRPGDVITIAVHSRVRVLKVVAPGTQRGSATLARSLFEELTPPVVGQAAAGDDGRPATEAPQRAQGSGRPTKRERRALDRVQRQSDD